MNSFVKAGLTVGLFAMSLGAGTASAQKVANHAQQPPANERTIEGLVRDVACPIENPKATATYFSLKCAKQCVKGGSPLIILTRKGIMYLPISTSMPDKSQRARLLPFVGKFVKVTGEVYERGGMRAIAVRTIREEKNVHLKSDL